jgi:AcrR family transcriptional regulator
MAVPPRYTDRMVSQATARVRRVRPERSLSQPAPRAKQDVVGEFRRSEILRAAGRVFAERGFEQATIADIAEIAGIAKGTVYLYYPSKQHIYSAALHRAATDLAVCARSAMAHETRVSGQVRAFIESTLRYFDGHRDVLRLCCSEAGRPCAQFDGPPGEAGDRFKEPVKALEPVLHRAVRCRALRRVRAAAAAVAVLDIVRGVASRRLLEGSRTPLDEDVAFAFDLTWKGIGRR